MDITLVILAAGIGSRFGGGVKQLDPVGPNGEVIIDFSIHDAIKAGFNKFVFILRHEIFDDFMEVIGDRNEELFKKLNVKWEYVFQEPDDFPEGRTKPWGTSHAVLACRKVLDGPFAVINADDYYGSNAYSKAACFLKKNGDTPGKYGMVGYTLKNTLSDIGGVTRGICYTDSDGILVGIDETHDICKENGHAVVHKSDGDIELDLNSLVSMNFWMYSSDYISALEKGFIEFRNNLNNPLKDEFLLPTFTDKLLKQQKCSVEVIPTDDRWFGVTYKEDKPMVISEFKKLYENGVYSSALYSDVIG